MIAGRYEPLDRGLARDTELGRVVRLRWLASRDEVDDPRLSHPNVVRVFDVGEHEGRRFAAVEHVEGLPLALVAPLSREAAIRLGIAASRALAAAHELGLVHAGEILVRADGVPKLSGFRKGEAGDDVRSLAEALNDASPELPPLHSSTTAELVPELERARPVPASKEAQIHVPVVPILLVLAVAALVIGLVFALGGGNAKSQRPKRPIAHVTPVPHAATPEEQARNLSAWLARYSR